MKACVECGAGYGTHFKGCPAAGFHPRVEDVPVAQRFTCGACKRVVERSRISALEVVLGGWARGKCDSCGAHTTFIPLKEDHEPTQRADG